MNLNKLYQGVTKKTFALVFLFLLAQTVFGQTHTQFIKVGLTASLTGAYKEQGSSLLQGLSMWANDINARGALLGRPIKIIYYDDQSNPELSAVFYERLITYDKVDLLVGPYASNLTYAASTIAEKYNFPMVSGTAAASSIWERGYKNIFQIDVPASEYMVKGLELFRALGKKRIGILFQDNLFTTEVANGAKHKAEALGLTVTVFERYPKDHFDFSTMIKQLKASNTEVLLGATYYEDSIKIIRETKQQNFNPYAIAFTAGPSVSTFGEELGKDSEGMIGFTPWIKAARQPMAYDFNFRYRHLYKHVASSNAAGGYAAGQVLEGATRLAKSLDKDALRSQLSQMSLLTLMGRYKVDETGKQIGKALYMLQWKDDNQVLIFPKNIAEKEFEALKPWSER